MERLMFKVKLHFFHCACDVKIACDRADYN